MQYVCKNVLRMIILCTHVHSMSIHCIFSKGTYGYDNYFGKIATNGGNYARLWLTEVAWNDLAVEAALGNISLANTWYVALF